jgi:hypothetical protein
MEEQEDLVDRAVARLVGLMEGQEDLVDRAVARLVGLMEEQEDLVGRLVDPMEEQVDLMVVPGADRLVDL